MKSTTEQKKPDSWKVRKRLFFTDILLVERDLDTYTFLTMSLSLL